MQQWSAPPPKSCLPPSSPHRPTDPRHPVLPRIPGDREQTWPRTAGTGGPGMVGATAKPQMKPLQLIPIFKQTSCRHPPAPATICPPATPRLMVRSLQNSNVINNTAHNEHLISNDTTLKESVSWTPSPTLTPTHSPSKCTWSISTSFYNSTRCHPHFQKTDIRAAESPWCLCLTNPPDDEHPP